MRPTKPITSTVDNLVKQLRANPSLKESLRVFHPSEFMEIIERAAKSGKFTERDKEKAIKLYEDYQRKRNSSFKVRK